MFTGLVEKSSHVVHANPNPSGLRLVIAHAWTDLELGESIAINGVCLTVCQFDDKVVHFDAIPETLSKTTLGNLTAGHRVHVERALRVGDRLGGHMVQGHVDGLATVISQTQTHDDWRLRASVEADFARYLVPKGSITLDGVSLTLAEVDAHHFEIALIPTTLDITQLGKRQPGDMLNVEFDMTVKTIVHYLQHFKGQS
jgi:riboflavin synthase